MKRVFVVGYPRSGTTFIQSIVMALGFKGVSESHFFSSLPHRNGLKSIVGYLRHFYYFCLWKRKNSIAITQTPYFSRENAGKAFLRALDHSIDKKQEFHGWVEKTPAHLHHVEELSKLCGDVGFLVVVRSPIAAIRSHMVAARHSKWRSITPERTAVGAAARWVADFFTATYLKKIPNVKVVYYEDFLTSWDSSVCDLCGWLGISTQTLRVDQLSDHADTIVDAVESWKSGNFDPMATFKSKRGVVPYCMDSLESELSDFAAEVLKMQAADPSRTKPWPAE